MKLKYTFCEENPKWRKATEKVAGVEIYILDNRDWARGYYDMRWHVQTDEEIPENGYRRNYHYTSTLSHAKVIAGRIADSLLLGDRCI